MIHDTDGEVVKLKILSPWLIKYCVRLMTKGCPPKISIGASVATGGDKPVAVEMLLAGVGPVIDGVEETFGH